MTSPSRAGVRRSLHRASVSAVPYFAELLEFRRLLSLAGDFTADQQFTAADIDALSVQIRAATHPVNFDLNGDLLVNRNDHTFLIQQIIGTKFGDADLDGDVDAADSARVQANFGQSNIGWAGGDFDASGKVDFGDLALLSPSNGQSVIGGPALVNNAAKLSVGLDAVNGAIDDWARLFNLTPIAGKTLPGVNDAIADVAGLVAATANAAPGFTNPSGVVATLQSRLNALGFTLISLPVAPGQSDITVRLLKNFTGLNGSREFDDGTSPLLTGLSSALNLNGSITHSVDLAVSLMLGVDASGFYLRGDSALTATVRGDGNISGSYALPLASLGLNLAGTFDADYTVTFTAGAPAVKIRTAQLVSNGWTRTQSGQGVVDLDLTLTRSGAPTSFKLDGLWTMPVTNAGVGTAVGGVATPDVDQFVHRLLPLLSPGLSSFLTPGLSQLLNDLNLPLASGGPLAASPLDPFSPVASSDEGQGWFERTFNDIVNGKFSFVDSTTHQGAHVTSADEALGARLARQLHNIDGEGVRVGVISDGAVSWQQAQAAGDLPSITVNPNLGIFGNGDEGTAMLEIVHDIAPGAELFFSGVAPMGDVTTYEDGMVAAIQWMIDNDVEVIIDDLNYFAEPWFDLGNMTLDIRDALNNAPHRVVYVSSAGNDHQVFHSEVFRGVTNLAVTAGGVIAGGTYKAHQFFDRSVGGTDMNVAFVPAPSSTKSYTIQLQWSDPAGGAIPANALQLLQIDDLTGRVVAISTPDPTQPNAVLNTVPETDGAVRLAVVSLAGNAAANLRFGLRFDNAMRVDDVTHVLDSSGFLISQPGGAIFAQRQLQEVVTVGALQTADPTLVATYSSRGPVFRRLPLGGTTTINALDVVGVDGQAVSGVGGFSTPFFGTSSNSPQVGAVAALLMEAFPGATSAQIQDALNASAGNIGVNGYDQASGFGIVRANDAYTVLSGMFNRLSEGGSASSPNGRPESGSGARLGLSMLAGRGITIERAPTAGDILQLLAGQSPSGDFLRLRYVLDQSHGHAPVRAEFTPDLLDLGDLSEQLDLTGTLHGELAARANIGLGLDATGFFLTSDSTIGGDITLDLDASARLADLDVALSGTASLSPRVQFNSLGTGKLRIGALVNPANLNLSVGTIAANATVDLIFNHLDYVDNNPTVANGPHGGDPFAFRATAGLTATQQAGFEFDFTFSPIDIQNPTFNGGNYSFANFLTNLYRYGQDELAGSGYLGELLDALETLVQPLSNQFKIGDEINEDLIQLVLNASNIELITPTNDQQFFNGLETWLQSGGASNFEFIKVRATITNLDLVEVLTVGGDLGQLLRNGSQPINLSNAKLNGQMVFGIDTAGGLFVDRGGTNMAVSIQVDADLNNKRLLGPFGAGDFMNLDAGSNLRATTTSRVVLAGAGKLRLADFFAPISGVTTSLDNVVATLTIPGADLLPRTESSGFNGRVENVIGTATFNGSGFDQLTLNASSTRFNLFNDELRLQSGPVIITWDPQSPSGQTLMSIASVAATFPKRSTWPTGTLTNLQMTGNAITLGALTVAGSDFIVAPILDIRSPVFTLNGASIAISPSAVTAIGGVSVSASQLALFPNTTTPALDGLVTVVNPTLTLNSMGLRFTALNATFKVGDLVTATATGTVAVPISVHPDATGAQQVFTLPTLTVSVPKLQVDGRTPAMTFSPNGSTPGLALRGDGKWDVGSVGIGFTGGGTATFGLGALVPFELGSFRIAFDTQPGGGANLDAFSVFMTGDVDEVALNSLLAPIFGSNVSTSVSIQSPPLARGKGGGGPEANVELKIRVDSLTDGKIGLLVNSVDVSIANAKIGILDFSGSLGIVFNSTTGLPQTVTGGLGFVVGGSSQVDEISNADAAGFDANQQGGSSSVSGIELNDAALNFAGTITNGTNFDLQIDSSIGIRLKLADFFELYGVRFGFDLDINGGTAASTFAPTVAGGLRSMAVRKVRVKLGDFLIVTGGSNTVDAATLNFTGSGNIAAFGPIAATLPQIKGSTGPALTGTVNNLVITQQGLPNLLPLPGVASTATIGLTGLGQFFSEEDEGIFSWLPITINSLSVKFQAQPFNDLNHDGIRQGNETFIDSNNNGKLDESIFEINSAGTVIGPGNAAAFDLGVSGSIGGSIDLPGVPAAQDPVLPFSAGVDGLVLDMLALYQVATTGSTSREIIKALDGVSGGVDPFALLPADQSENIPFTIGGSFGIGKTPAGDYYLFVNGDFKYQDMGGSVTLAISNRGPLFASLALPLAVPIGPTPFLLSGARGAIEWAIGPLDTPTDPIDMLDNPPNVPTQIDTSNLSQLVQTKLASLGANEFTWDQGVAMGLGGTITLAGVPDGLSGNVDLAINIGKPRGTPVGQFGLGVQVYGQGTIDAMGFPLAEAGLLFDFVNPIEPEVLMAFRMPAAGNPLGFLMPANAEFAVHLKTDGVLMAPIVAVRSFINGMISSAGADLDAIAARLDADRLDGFASNDRVLTSIILDADGNGTVSALERTQTINRAFLLHRLLGTAMSPAPVVPQTSQLLPSTLTAAGALNDAALARALKAFNGFQQEYYAIHTVGGQAFINNFLASLGNSSQLAGLAALEQFNPTLSIRGKIQPVVFGFPVGDALAEATISISKQGVGFDVGANLTALLRKMIAQNNPALETMAYAFSLDLDIRGSFGFQRDFTDEWSFLVNGLLGKKPDPSATASDLGGYLIEVLNPFDDWNVSFAGQVEFLGFPMGRVSGLFFGPASQSPQTTQLLADKLRVIDPFGPLAIDAYKDFSKIPVSSQSRIDNMAITGGLLLTGQLLAPAIIQDPVALFKLIDQQVGWTPPAITGNVAADIAAYQTWINGIIGGVTTSDEFARIQMFIPSPALLFDLDNLSGANANYLKANFTSDATIDNVPGETLTFDANGNGRWEPGDTFIDVGNGRFDAGETVDLGNGIWDPGEILSVDRNGDGVFDPPDQFDDLDRDGVRDADEPFIDLNGNGVFDAGDTFIDIGDGVITPGEAFTDLNGNGRYDGPDPFDDLNHNKVRDANEPFDDQNRDGVFSATGEPFVDRGNGVWDGPANNATARLPKKTNPADISTALAAIGNAFFIEGYTDPKLFGLDLGRGKLTVDAVSGMQFQFRANWLGVSVDINAGLGFQNQDLTSLLDDLLTSPLISPLIGGTNLNNVRTFLSTHAASLPRHIAFPVGFAEVDINTAGLTQFLNGVLKVPSSILSLPAAPGASFSMGFYTPGYSQPGAGVPAVEVYGGLTLDATVNLPGLLEDAQASFEMTFPKVDLDSSLFSLNDLLGAAINAFPDFHISATASRFAPSLAGATLVKITGANASDPFGFTVDKVGTQFNATLNGRIELLPDVSDFALAVNGTVSANLSVANPSFDASLLLNVASGTDLSIPGIAFNLPRLGTTFRLLIDSDGPKPVLLRVDGEFNAGGLYVDGVFDLTVDAAIPSLVAEGAVIVRATAGTGAGAPNLISLAGNAGIKIAPTGIAARGSLTFLGGANPTLGLGFGFASNALFEINTFASAQTINGISIATGLKRVAFDTDLQLGPFGFTAGASITVSSTSATLAITAGTETLPVFGTFSFSGSLTIQSTGFATNLTLTRVASPGEIVGIGGTFTLAVNTLGAVDSFAISSSNASITLLGLNLGLPGVSITGVLAPVPLYTLTVTDTGETENPLSGLPISFPTMTFGYRLLMDSAGQFRIDGGSNGSYATATFSGWGIGDSSIARLSLNSVGLQVVRTAAGQPVRGRLKGTGTLALPIVGESYSLTSRLSFGDDLNFAAEATGTGGTTGTFGIYVDLERDIPSQLFDGSVWSRSNIAQSWSEMTALDPVTQPAEPKRIDISSAFIGAGTWISNSPDLGKYAYVGGTTLQQQIEIPEQNDALTLRATGLTAGQSITVGYTINFPVGLLINEANRADVRSNLTGSFVLTAASPTINLNTILDDRYFEFNEDLVITFTYATGGFASTSLIKTTNSLAYKIINTDAELDRSLAYWEFDTGTNASGGYTRSPTFVGSPDITVSDWRHTSENGFTAVPGTPGIPGGPRSLDFEASELDYVSIPASGPSFTANDLITVETWVQPESFSGSDVFLVAGPVMLYVNGTTSKFGAIITSSTGTTFVREFGTATLGTWTHVAISYSGTSFVAYINGGSVLTATPTFTQLGSQRAVLMGTDNPTGSASIFFDGRLDEVRVWNIQRSAALIGLNDTNAIDPLTANLVGYWQFDQNDDVEAVYDITGQHVPAMRGNGQISVPALSTTVPTVSYVGNLPVAAGTNGGLPQTQPETLPTGPNTDAATNTRWGSNGNRTRLYFPFDDAGSTGNTVNDASPFGFDGVFTNKSTTSSQYVGGVHGSAVRFAPVPIGQKNGFNPVMVPLNVANALTTADDFSVSFWAKSANFAPATAAQESVFFYYDDGSGFHFSVSTDDVTGGLIVGYAQGTNTEYTVNLSDLGANSWHHFFIEVDGGSGAGGILRVWVDGAIRTDTNVVGTFAPFQNVGQMTIGGLLAGTPDNFTSVMTGAIDDFAILQGTRQASSEFNTADVLNMIDYGVAFAMKPLNGYQFHVGFTATAATNLRLRLDALRFFDFADSVGGPTEWLLVVSDAANVNTVYARVHGNTTQGEWGGQYAELRNKVFSVRGPLLFTLYGIGGTNGNWRVENVNLEGVVLNANSSAPIRAIDDRVEARGNGTTDFNVLANDLTNGTTSIDPNSILVGLPSGVTASVVGNSIRFVVDSTFGGEFELPYIIRDATGNESGATMRVRVPDMPQAANEKNSVIQGGTVNIPVLLNDYDGVGSGLTITIVTPPPAGLGTISVVSGQVRFVASASATPGAYQYTYRITDAHGRTSTAVNDLTINSAAIVGGAAQGTRTIASRDRVAEGLPSDGPARTARVLSRSGGDAIRVTVRPVIVATPSANNATILPTSLASVGVGQSFFVEVWVQDVIDHVGITGGSIDLAYTTARADAISMSRPEFGFIATGTIADTAGIVDDFGGGTLSGGLGVSPTFIRLGVVQVTATSAGTMNVSLAQGAFEFALFGVGNVPFADVDLSAAASLNVTGGIVLSAPALASGQDTGVSTSDNITRLSRPIFTGTAGLAGQTLELLAGAAVVGSTTVGAGGVYSVQPTLAIIDGIYAFAIRIGASNSSATSVQIDATAPTAFAPIWDRNLSPHRVAMSFSELLGGTFSLADLTLQNLTTALSVSNASMSLPASATTAFTLSFPGLANARLADGRYILSVPTSGVTDIAGNVLASPIAFNFSFMAGDADGSGTVGFDDLLVLAQNYNFSGRNFSQGDFNYDGTVNFDDLLLLAQRYNQSVLSDSPLLSRKRDRLLDL